ncbi:MAG: hypothetical protein MI924_13150 [Chloroflexales bacterium]|nr:hypothetical protein [Chloroflexales bacterium]
MHPPERTQSLLITCKGLLAYHDNNHLPLVWQFYRSQRSTLYRLARTLTFHATSADQTLLDAVTFLLDQQEHTAAQFTICRIRSMARWRSPHTNGMVCRPSKVQIEMDESGSANERMRSS